MDDFPPSDPDWDPIRKRLLTWPHVSSVYANPNKTALHVGVFGRDVMNWESGGEMPNQLSEFTRLYRNLERDWNDLNFGETALIVHSPVGLIQFETRSEIQHYLVGLQEMWEILESRVPESAYSHIRMNQPE